ncbi:MAG: hypothetical protein AMXMBFR36_15140 [Acidobacteriota bacterium]
MPVVKRIVCLANSKKHSGRCVAGRETTAAGAGPWIRPVSARPSEEVSENERQYEDGSDPRLLDIVDIPLIRAAPHACQAENWLLDPGYYWSRVRRANWTELLPLVETPTTLWVNGHSTYHGQHDEIPQAVADALPGSLYLIRVNALELYVFAPQEAFGNPKRRVQARFTHGDVTYALWVTDPIVEREYLARPDGYYQLGECCLTISLGEPFQKSDGQPYRYKLVAAIIRRSEEFWP